MSIRHTINSDMEKVVVVTENCCWIFSFFSQAVSPEICTLVNIAYERQVSGALAIRPFVLGVITTHNILIQIYYLQLIQDSLDRSKWI
jgi:hypothetical protein